MKEKSLHQIMNDIVGRLDTLQPSEPVVTDDNRLVSRQKLDPLSEIDAFMQFDDLLAHLYRQYLEAKFQRLDLSKAHGANDPMVEVAIDLEDSAYCAFQTRYMEVREVREVMAKVQRLMREREEAIEAEKAKEREQEFRNFILLAKAQEKLREKNKRGGFEWAVLLLMFNLVPIPKFTTNNNLNARMAA